MRWLFHFAEPPVTKHRLLQGIEDVETFSLLTRVATESVSLVRADEKLTSFVELERVTGQNLAL